MEAAGGPCLLPRRSGGTQTLATHLEGAGIAIEADFEWPGGGRSLYVRDPAGNSVEFAEPRIWKLPRKHRTLTDTKLVVASHNRGKLREIAELLVPYGVDTVMAGDLGLPEPEETETTFAGNARLKAEPPPRRLDMLPISDDSGLCVDSLQGNPGVYSARWAGPTKDFVMAMRNIEEKAASGRRHGPRPPQGALRQRTGRRLAGRRNAHL